MHTHTLELAQKARTTGLFPWCPPGESAGTALGLADLGLVRVKGPEAAKFLHGQVTNEVSGLSAGQGNLSARVTQKGTLSRIFSLHYLPNSGPQEIWMVLERPLVAGLIADLDKYLFSDCAMTDASAEYGWLMLQGPQAAQLAEKVWPNANVTWGLLEEFASARLPDGVVVLNRSLTGDFGLLIAIPVEHPDPLSLVEKVEAAAREMDFAMPSVDDLAYLIETFRVEAGAVRVGVDVQENERVLPQTGLEQQVVSYTKGCYLGQEIIARIRTYGSVPEALRGLIFETPDPSTPLIDALPERGAPVLTKDNKKIGVWASRTYSPTLKATIAFAYLDRNSRTPGQKLNVKDKDGKELLGKVQILPFYRAPNRHARAKFLHDKAIHLFSELKDKEAVELLEEAVRLDPGLADAYEALGVILGRTERYHEAIDIFKRLEEVAPNEPMVHTNLSLFYMKIGDKTKAEEEMAKATVKRFSHFADLKSAEAREKEEAEKRRADAARKKAMFGEVLEIDAEDPIAWFGMGNAHAALDEWEDAAKCYAKASEFQKDNSPVYLAYGKSLERLNRNAEAKTVYQRGMEVASRKGDLMPLKEMEHRLLLLANVKQ